MVDERVVGWLRRRTALVDAGTAGLLVLVAVLFGLLIGADVAYFALSVLLLAPLAVRRRWPEAVAVAIAAVAFAQWCTVRDTTGALPADIAVPFAVYTLAAHSTRIWSRGGLVLGLVGAVLGGWSWPQLPMPALAHLLVGGFLASTVLVAWLGGAWQRSRRGEFRALAEHAALLERARDERTRLAVLSERTRIARDMHDILAHSLAVIVAQADGGRYAAPADPRSAIDALRAIGEQGRRALAEARRAIGVLRADTDSDPAARVAVSDITRLVEEVRGAGLPVTLDLDVPAEPADAGVSLVIYRIVQEGLTNVVKHAGPGARAEVSVRRERDRWQVSVVDDGRSTRRSARPGYGLIGMRERVEAYGGELELLARPDAEGHVLTARIPLRSGDGR